LRGSSYEKYDMSRPLYTPDRERFSLIADASNAASKVKIEIADGVVDTNDVTGLLLAGRKSEVDGLIEQLKADGKLTEAEKVERIKVDFEKDQDLYLKNFTELRNNREIRGKDFMDALPRVLIEEFKNLIVLSNINKASFPESKLSSGARLRNAFRILVLMSEEELVFTEKYIKQIEEARSEPNKDQAQ
jgi:hypothetical protein